MTLSYFLSTYIRPDDGTAIVLAYHRTCTQTAAWFVAESFHLGHIPGVIVYDVENDTRATDKWQAKVAELRAKPSVRRIALVVCEPREGCSFRDAMDVEGKGGKRVDVFRISSAITSPTSFFSMVGDSAVGTRRH